jgi:hypothetical protein
VNGEHFDTEDDADRPDWRSPRERLGPVSAAEAVLWAVLDRWDFVDVDGWAQLLADALDAVPDPAAGRRAADALRAGLRRFADSDARSALAAADEVHRNVEFLADLADLAAAGADGPAVTARGLIDFLYRDGDGWHVLGVDLGTTDEDDPWRGRQPGLVLAAWAVRRQLTDGPATVELFDLAAGQLVRADPRKANPAAAAAQLMRGLKPSS